MTKIKTPNPREAAVELRDAFPDAAKLMELIPEHMRNSVSMWILYGVLPGDFFRAVLSNDLRLAVLHADDINGKRLYDWVQFFHNYAPTECHGSDDKMRRWAKRGGLLGRKAEDAA